MFYYVIWSDSEETFSHSYPSSFPLLYLGSEFFIFEPSDTLQSVQCVYQG